MPNWNITCVAKNCGYVYNKDVRLKVFRFPLGAGTDGQFEKWMEKMEVDTSKYKMDRRSMPRWGICEQHFLKKCCYDYEQGSRLKVGAIPTLLQDDDKQWRKVSPDYDALGEEHTNEIKRGLELDHTYREPGDEPPPAVVRELEAICESPAKKRKAAAAEKATEQATAAVDALAENEKMRAERAAAAEKATKQATAAVKALAESEKAKAEIADMKRRIHTQNLQLKRMEEKLRRRDSRRDDLQYAVDKLKDVLQCCECGLKPASKAELAEMLKRKKEKPAAAGPSQKGQPPKANLPTKVVCRNDLVVGLSWKQLFARVNSIAQETADS